MLNHLSLLQENNKFQVKAYIFNYLANVLMLFSSKAENMTWGKGLGCDFVKKSCLSWMLREEGPYPFCTLMGSMT